MATVGSEQLCSATTRFAARKICEALVCKLELSLSFEKLNQVRASRE